MSQELVLAVLGLVVAAIVFGPLIRGRTKPSAGATIKDHGPAAASADELAELELDHEMGRVSDADYAKWRGEFGTIEPPAPDEVSAQDTGAISKAEELVRRFRDQPRSRCPKCGERPEPDARFCSNCGNSLV
jgi:cytochrome c-type biogenesis protein CcmH/NrfG